MKSVKTLISGTALSLAAAVTATPAAAGELGVLGLYQVRDAARYAEALSAIEKSLGGRGCVVRREGEVVAADGSLRLATPNRFLVLECGGSLLKDGASRTLLEPLRAVTTHSVFAEGELERSPGALSTPGIGREYIIKVGHYNNRDPELRDRDLAAILHEVAPRSDGFRSEAMITPSRALGMMTPDEVVVVYYDNPKQGDRFRQGNGDILSKIGAFNKAHLVECSYFSAVSTR